MARHPGDENEAAKRPSQWSQLRRFFCRLFVRLGARSHDVDDLAQEGLARVIAFERHRDGPVSLGYAATIGKNLWRDQLRRRMRRPEIEPVLDSGDVADRIEAPPSIAARNEDERNLAAAIETLDPRHGDAIKLIVIERATYAEAAKLLGVPRGTVKSRVHYGMERLRDRLDPSRREGRGRPC